MNKLLVTDIFGKTPALEELCSKLEGQVQIVDPYKGAFLKFDDEVEAYKHFKDVMGLKNYSELLKEVILNQKQAFKMIGFSVGASVIWMNSQNKNLKHICNAQCFYGSQIRNMTNIDPLFPIDIIMPLQEAHFSVEELSQKLNQKQNVKIEKTPYLHGFMNKQSKNFNEKAYQSFVTLQM
ncbi:MAG: dienelactone hydrolase family protein [Campylobacteraceae bacterium]|nr:dienelactone hydrolase family protein [Campylobacteraceae bacterium]